MHAVRQTHCRRRVSSTSTRRAVFMNACNISNFIWRTSQLVKPACLALVMRSMTWQDELACRAFDNRLSNALQAIVKCLASAHQASLSSQLYECSQYQTCLIIQALIKLGLFRWLDECYQTSLTKARGADLTCRRGITAKRTNVVSEKVTS